MLEGWGILTGPVRSQTGEGAQLYSDLCRLRAHWAAPRLGNLLCCHLSPQAQVRMPRLMFAATWKSLWAPLLPRDSVPRWPVGPHLPVSGAFLGSAVENGRGGSCLRFCSAGGRLVAASAPKAPCGDPRALTSPTSPTSPSRERATEQPQVPFGVSNIPWILRLGHRCQPSSLLPAGCPQLLLPVTHRGRPIPESRAPCWPRSSIAMCQSTFHCLEVGLLGWGSVSRPPLLTPLGQNPCH